MDTMGDLSLDSSSLQESLEAEFCPHLDSTIIALLIADHISGEEPSDEILKTLRDQLAELAAGATVDQDELAKDFHDLNLSVLSATTEDSLNADSVFSQSGFEASSSSASSTSPPREAVPSFQSESPLVFLQASFPHLPLKRLKMHLDAADLDMEKIVEDLLSEEYVRELEERGLEDETLNDELEQWTFITKKPRTPSRSAKKSRKAKGRTIVINDVRQRHQNRSDAQSYSAGDPWSQVTSLSSYLETFLDRPSSFFRSYFHRPEYPTPAEALRAALRSIEQESKGKAASENKQVETADLIPLMDFIRDAPEFDFDNLDSEAQTQLCADTELSLVASGGSPDKALDIVKLLHELEKDGETTQEMGLYHSPVSALPSPISPQSSFAAKTTPPVSPISRSSSIAIHFTPPSAVSKRRPPPAPSKNEWQIVTPARPRPPDVHPLAVHIPAYNPRNVPRRKMHPAHSSVTNHANHSFNRSQPMNRIKGAPGTYKVRIAEAHARRNEALRIASRHWNNGGTRNHGGEVALYYAQEAQRHQTEAQQLQLDASRERVDGKRRVGVDTDTIDMHYCTTSEALTIVREVLDEGWVSAARPLRVITGRGNHSSGGIAVLGPALKKALEQDGWSVATWDGGIRVRGRIR